MVVGRANSEELNVVESDEEITMLPPFYESHVKHSEFTQAIVNSNVKNNINNARRNISNHENETACDSDSVASSTNGHCPDDKSEDCDNTKLEDADKEVYNLYIYTCKI